MIEIIPAILPKNYEDMKDKIALVRGHAELVQIDFCDGIFVPSRTWPFSTGGGDDYYFQRIINEQEGMPFWEDLDFELDLMVADAISNFDIYTKLSPKRIIFHLESVGNIEEFKDFLEGIDVYVRDSIEMGIAIGLTTPVEQIYPLANSVDFVQVMGIEKIGIQGEEFSAKAIEYVKNLREKFGDLPIAVDGGVNLENAPKLIDAGATRLAIGSAIFNTTDIIDSIEEFRRLG
jgi:ribulose-phosphate 3-epimerase